MSENEQVDTDDQETQEAMPALPVAMYPNKDDHRAFLVDLELSFFHGPIVVKDGIVVDVPQMLNWTQKFKDGSPRETPLKEVIEWYKRPGKVDKDGNEKYPEFVDATITAIIG